MSIRSIVIRGALPAGLACLLSATPGLAQRTTFNPSVSVGFGYTDNIQFVDNEPLSDQVTGLRADLPWIHETRTRSLRLRYRPVLLRYDEFDQLDRDEHDLTFNVNKTRRSGVFRIAARARFDQYQGNAASIDDSDLFLNERSDRELYRAGFFFEQDRSRRWSWRAGVEGVIRNYDTIEGGVPGDLNVAVEDRTEARADFRFSRNLSRTQSIGAQYGYRFFDLEFSGEEQVHLGSFVYDHELSRRTRMEVQVGGFYSDREPDSSLPVPADFDQQRDGFQGRFRLARDYRAVQLAFEASHQPTSGGSGLGTSTNSVIALTLRDRGESPWTWRVSPRLARREPSSDAGDTRTSAAIRADVERMLTRDISARIDTSYVDQAFNESTSTESSVFRAGFLIVWYPMARTELARGR